MKKQSRINSIVYLSALAVLAYMILGFVALLVLYSLGLQLQSIVFLIELPIMLGVAYFVSKRRKLLLLDVIIAVYLLQVFTLLQRVDYTYEMFKQLEVWKIVMYIIIAPWRSLLGGIVGWYLASRRAR